jgi:hypothetical protein
MRMILLSSLRQMQLLVGDRAAIGHCDRDLHLDDHLAIAGQHVSSTWKSWICIVAT